MQRQGLAKAGFRSVVPGQSRSDCPFRPELSRRGCSEPQAAWAPAERRLITRRWRQTRDVACVSRALRIPICTALVSAMSGGVKVMSSFPTNATGRSVQARRLTGGHTAAPTS